MSRLDLRELSEEELFKQNPNIDKELVEANDELERASGQNRRTNGSDYRLSPPLGDSTILLYNH